MIMEETYTYADFSGGGTFLYYEIAGCDLHSREQKYRQLEIK